MSDDIVDTIRAHDAYMFMSLVTCTMCLAMQYLNAEECMRQVIRKFTKCCIGSSNYIFVRWYICKKNCKT